jgi:hypothetical protein
MQDKLELSRKGSRRITNDTPLEMITGGKKKMDVMKNSSIN